MFELKAYIPTPYCTEGFFSGVGAIAGGWTAYPAEGGYVTDKGHTLYEEVLVVEVVAADQYTVRDLVDHINETLVAEESVLITVKELQIYETADS